MTLRARNHLLDLLAGLRWNQIDFWMEGREYPEHLVCEGLPDRFDALKVENYGSESVDSREQSLCLRSGHQELISELREFDRDHGPGTISPCRDHRAGIRCVFKARTGISMKQSRHPLLLARTSVPTRRIGVVVTAFVAGALTTFSSFGESPRFDRDIWPIFAERCIKCHGEAEQEGDLRLDSPEFILQGGEYGPVIKAGTAGLELVDPHESTPFEWISFPDDDPDRSP